MSRIITVSTLTAAVTILLAACAELPPATQEGTVSAVFVEPLPGILLSPGITEAGIAGSRWAEITLDPSAPDGGRTLARLPDDVDIDVGDRVMVQPATPGSMIDLPLPGVPGMKSVRPMARGARPAMVSAVHWRIPRVEVLPP
jgi:hypothetical protein